MQEILSAIESWETQKKPLAEAIVVKTWGSSPRGPGSKMVISSDGEMAGSVSGGCVESAVVETGISVINTGQPRLLHFGVGDETAWRVGLSCGGEIEVFIKPLALEEIHRWRSAQEGSYTLGRALVIGGAENLLGEDLLSPGNNQRLANIAHSQLDRWASISKSVIEKGYPVRETFETADGLSIEIFFDAINPPPILVIVGGAHIAIPLVSIAKALGYVTILIDPRRQFGSRERFPKVDRLINTWPQNAFKEIQLSASTAVAFLTHDPKIDDPGLEIVLHSAAFYIGALGSKTTQARRKERLLAAGLTENQVNRIKGPIGLNLGGRTPAEIALAIMAEIIQVRNQK